VPAGGIPAAELLRLVVEELPGWQATSFPSHVILYPADRLYAHGIVIAFNRGAADEAHPDELGL
jgi:hypothetical protein